MAIKILYIFPHPDDESFGPAPAIARQLRKGHEVHLLTLTKGEATKERIRLGISQEEMGELRFREMQCVEKVLGLTSMTVLDLPDNQFKTLDPRIIEAAIETEVKRLKPDVLVTYPVHGISGFHDHLVCHAVVKRLFLRMRDEGAGYLKRLAFFSVLEPEKPHEGIHRLSYIRSEDIACRFSVSTEDIAKFHKALDCYETYQQVIKNSRVREAIGSEAVFEIFMERFSTPINGLDEQLNSNLTS